MQLCFRHFLNLGNLTLLTPFAAGELPNSGNYLLFSPNALGSAQIKGMQTSQRKTFYRVRPMLAIEETVPNEIKGACFESRQDAEIFALDMVKDQSTPMIVEKLAPAGCWLQVLAVGC